jgi:SAM-dependent methyltransferase
MRGQPCVDAGLPEPFAATADTYDRLAAYAIEEWGETPRGRMADFYTEVWQRAGRPVRTVLEICCGTGLVLTELAGRGYEVTGLDRSEAMLALARDRVGDRARLVLAELPAIPLTETFDAVVGPACGLSFTPDQDTLLKTFHAVAAVLRPGGSFTFDILSQSRLETEFAQTWAGDLGDLAFIWRFAHAPGGGHSDLAYTQFTRAAGGPADEYDITREIHRLYVLDRAVVRSAAAAAGFIDVAVYDNYSWRPADDATAYETWTLTRAC